jgi:uncharacterized protein (TIGR03086 family)
MEEKCNGQAMMLAMDATEADARDLFARAAAATRVVVIGVRADQLDDPSPCSEFTVRDLLAHLLEAVVSLGSLGADEAPAGVPPVGSEVGDVVDAYDTAVASTVEIWQAEGAMEREYAAPWGPSSADQLLRFLVIEILVHGWDIARATAQSPPADGNLAGLVYDWAVRNIDDRARIPGVYGPEVPVAGDAAAIDRLAGFLGRSPDWDEWRSS